MAKWIVTTQKDNIPGLKSSSRFNDFSLVWDNSSEETTKAFLTVYENTFKGMLDAAGLQRSEKEEIFEKVNELTTGGMEKLKDKGWVNWTKKD